MNFTKMYACGEDFLITMYEDGVDYPHIASKVLNRIQGIGANRLIVCKPSPLEMLVYDIEGKREVYNTNALVCFAKYAFENGLSRTREMTILTGAGRIKLLVSAEIPFMARLNLDKPNFNNRMIYVNDSLDSFGRVIRLDDTLLTIYSFNLLGVNTIIFVDDINNKNMLDLAPRVAEYKIFNRKTDVLFVKVVDKKHLRIKCYKPGLGFVNTAGSGCGAALVAASKLGLIRGKVTCELDEGEMNPEIDKKGNVFVDITAYKISECNYNEEDI